MRIEVATAAIAAVASLGGSIVGGGLAYLANERLQQEQDERQRAGARAVAMLEVNRFSNCGDGPAGDGEPRGLFATR